MKVAVIGGGSTYTPELVKGFLRRVSTFPLTELWLADIDLERLLVVGEFARRMVKAHGAPFQIHLATNSQRAIEGASYVITQLRVGQMEARRQDEYLGKRHGLIGQETTGIGGMAKALRTIPVILQIAAEMRSLAPGALLVNFTNPAGLVTQALSQYAPGTPSVGVCNVALTTLMKILQRFEQQTGASIDPQRVSLQSLGLNHLTWHYGFTLDGENVWQAVLQSYLAELRSSPDPEWDPAFIERLGMIPNYYLNYFYNTPGMLEKQMNWPPSRAEQVMTIEKDLLQQYARESLVEPPPALMQRGGAYYSTAATQLLNAHYNDLGETHVVNVVHGGAVPGWPEHWVLEMPARVGRAAIHPLPAFPLPVEQFDLISQVKRYELFTVEAAVHGDREAALQALISHPLGLSPEKAPVVLDDILETHRQFLPSFFSGKDASSEVKR